MGCYCGFFCVRSTRFATMSYRQCVKEFPLIWPLMTAGKFVFCRKGVVYAKWRFGTFYQNCASCLQQDVSWLIERYTGPVVCPNVITPQSLGFLFMGTFITLIYSIHLQLKKKTAFFFWCDKLALELCPITLDKSYILHPFQKWRFVFKTKWTKGLQL